MKLDEKKLDKKQITWEQYEKKWYSGSTMKQTA
jgi:hypothetical protein